LLISARATHDGVPERALRTLVPQVGAKNALFDKTLHLMSK